MASNVAAFVPSEQEIRRRMMAQRMMTLLEWEIDLVESIMLEDTPTIPTVFRLVRMYGHDEAYLRMRSFLYDD